MLGMPRRVGGRWGEAGPTADLFGLNSSVERSESVHRISAIVARGVSAEIDKAKSNQVYRVQWIVGEESGSAWVQTKSQLDQIIHILRMKSGVQARVETFLIPRDKAGLVGFLNAYQDGQCRPTAVLVIANDE